MTLTSEKSTERNDALTNLLKKQYPNHIRLSVHQHLNNGEKFSVRILVDKRYCLDYVFTLRTPEHNVLVIGDSGQFILMPYNK